MINFAPSFGTRDFYHWGARHCVVGKDIPIDTFLNASANRHHSTFYHDYVKRALDIAIALLAAPIWVPMLLIMIVVTAILTGSPIYTQKRVGRDGHEFLIFKVRTMIRNADTHLQDHLRSDPVATAEWDLHQKLAHDPRVTSFRRVLRKTSMDELPQILNVLLGQMSFVGPGPMLPNRKSMYPGEAYYRMRPGITGLWQVSERNQSSFVARESYDSRYYTSMSLRTDLMILLRTVRVVVSCNGS